MFFTWEAKPLRKGKKCERKYLQGDLKNQKVEISRLSSPAASVFPPPNSVQCWAEARRNISQIFSPFPPNKPQWGKTKWNTLHALSLWLPVILNETIILKKYFPTRAFYACESRVGGTNKDLHFWTRENFFLGGVGLGLDEYCRTERRF